MAALGESGHSGRKPNSVPPVTLQCLRPARITTPQGHQDTRAEHPMGAAIPAPEPAQRGPLRPEASQPPPTPRDPVAAPYDAAGTSATGAAAGTSATGTATGAGLLASLLVPLLAPLIASDALFAAACNDFDDRCA